MSFKFEKIDKNHPIFSSDAYDKDRQLFNYIEGARRFDDNELFSDGEDAIICHKHNHDNIWIWTSLEVVDDANMLISIANKIIDIGVEAPEIYARKEIAQHLSDMYALASRNLDYLPNDTYSMGAYKFKSPKNNGEFSIEKIDSVNQKKIVSDFYTNLKDEFRWNNEKLEHFINEYAIMEGYILKVDNKPVSIAIIDAGEGKLADIRSVATLENERNKGYASALISYIAEKLNGDVMSYSNIGNLAATQMWNKTGFESIGEITLIKKK